MTYDQLRVLVLRLLKAQTRKQYNDALTALRKAMELE